MRRRVGEGRLGADAPGIIADKDQHLSRHAGGHAVRLDELGRLLGGEGPQLRLMGLDLGVQGSSHLRAIARRLALAEAVVVVIGPARNPARRRTRAILPAT